MAHCTCTSTWNLAGSGVNLSSILSYAWKEDKESESEDWKRDEAHDSTSCTDPTQPVILQPPDVDTPTSCEVHIACREHSNAEIVGLAVVSSAHHIEIFTKDGYQTTGRGEVVCKAGDGSARQQTLYHADLALTYPVTDMSIRFVTLADRSRLIVYIIEVVLSPCKPRTELHVPGRVNHQRVHEMLGESGVELSDGAKKLMSLVESQQQNQGGAMGQQTSNMAAILPLLGMFSGSNSGRPLSTPPNNPTQASSPSSRTPMPSKTASEIQSGDFANMLQKLSLTDQAGASGLNGELMFSLLQNVCKEVTHSRQTPGAGGEQVLTEKKGTSSQNDIDVGHEQATCHDELGDAVTEEEIKNKSRFVTEHEMSDMENRIMGNMSSMEERIMGRVDSQLQGIQDHIESKLDAVLNAVLSKKADS